LWWRVVVVVARIWAVAAALVVLELELDFP
jgi:hypothetical protein